MIRRISVDTILNAKKGDESAIQTILNYYKGYMLELCKFELYDASGKIYVCYDEDLYQELQFKLIKENAIILPSNKQTLIIKRA